MIGQDRSQDERIHAATDALERSEQLAVLAVAALIIEARPYGSKRATVEAITDELQARGITLNVHRVAAILARTDREGLTESSLYGARLTAAGEWHLWQWASPS